MKKTRILAALLCVMMVFSMLPLMASAAVSYVLYNTMGGLVGMTSSRPVENDATWFGMNFDFTDKFAETDGITKPEGVTYDNTNGLTFPTDTVVTWKYFPSGSDQWSPLALGGYYLRIKLNENGMVEAQACKLYSHNRSFVIINPTGITVFEDNTETVENTSDFKAVTNLVDYQPGTDWNDFVVVADGNGYSVYMKKTTDETFVKVATTTSYRPGGGWKSTGMTLSGKDSYISDAVMLQGSELLLGEEEDTTPNPGISEDLLKATGAVLGGSYAKPATSSADWAATNLVFTESFDSTQDGIITSIGVTYTANGLTFPDSFATWRYRPTCQHNGWSPLCISGNVTFGFKINPGGTIQVQTPQVWNQARAYIDFTTTDVVVWNGGATNGETQAVTTNLVDYAPGTEWNDVVIIAHQNEKEEYTGAGYEVYMKKASDKEFTHVASAPTYRMGSAWNSTGLEFSGIDASVNYAISYVAAEQGAQVDSIGEVIGSPVATTYLLSLDESYNTTLNFLEGSTTVGISHDGTYTEDGWKGVNWKFLPTAAWSPLTSGGEDTAIYFKAKTASKFNVQGRPATGSGRLYIDISANERPYSNAPTKTNHSDSVPGTDWAEYLITRYNEGAGYALYMKSETGTAGKWEQMITTSDYQSTNATGLALYSGNSDTYFKDVKILSTTKAVADSTTKLMTATTLYYQDDFTDKPDYSNLSCVGAIYDGDLVLTETSETAAEAVLANAEIPKGGYAEYRIKVGNTNPTMFFYDGERCFSIYNRVNYGAIYDQGTTLLYASDAGSTYRTWRVVRHLNGNYSAYCKIDDDNNWFAAQVNVVGKEEAHTPQIKLVGTTAYDGSAGVTELDYLKIYGPTPEQEVTITDGAGTKIITGREQPVYLEGLSAIIKADSSKDRVFVFAVYGENGNLVDLEQKEIPAGSESTLVRCNPLRKTSSVTKIKAFLWDNFRGMVPVIDNLEIKGNASTWADDWNFSGKVQTDGDKIYLTSVANAEAYAEYETEIGTQFDISWEMEVETFSGEENVQIYTGTNLYLLSVSKDGITYNTNAGTAKFPWVIGNGKHEYRLFGNNGSGSLFIDGFFVGDLTNVATSTEDAKIRFWNKGVSDVEVSRIIFGSYAESNIPKKGFYDEFNNGDLCGWSNAGTQFSITKNSVTNTFTKQWVNSKNGNLVVEDYHLGQSPNYCVTSSSKNITEVGDELVIQAKIRFSSWGSESYMVTEVGGKRLTLDFREKYFSVGVDKGYSTEISDEFLLGTTDYHELTIETYNRKNNARIYLNGKLVQETPLATATDGLNRVYFQANGGWYLPATMEIEYFKYAPKYYNLTVNAPSNHAEYFVGESVELNASAHCQFVLNGATVANGTSATLENLSAGSYQVVAKSGSNISEIIHFTVRERATATVRVSQTETSITASLGSISGFDSVAKVSYLLDGKKVGEVTANPYQVTISDVSAESHMLEAVAYDKNEIVVARFSKEIPAVISGNVTTAFANEISYTVPTSGGTVEIKNGIHRLYMQHKSNGITYTTASGRKVYAKGTGSFKVLTDGPFAEVYRNGQYVFGFIMPKTTEVGTFFGSGITEVSVVVPKERQNIFVARDLNIQKGVYELANMTHNHNLDFVASPEDEVRLVLSDGYYRNDISLKNGKIYVWEAEKNNSVAKEKEVMKMPSGDTYYRLETVAGMSRLYVDGKWSYTFRNGIVAGKDGVLAVDVTGGNGLSYLSVNQSQDLYLLSDTFDQSGEFVSTDYWMTSNGMTAVQNGEDLLLTSTAQNGIAELSSSVGNASLTAHLTVISGTQGFWFVTNHAVTNSYTKVGYNFSTGKYEIIDVINGNEVDKVTKDGTLSADARVLMKVVVEDTDAGKCVSLYVDGNKVISKNNCLQARGRIGFMVANGKASLGYVVYRGDAKPMLDMRDNPIPKGDTTLDMIETEDMTYLFNSMDGAYTTTDGGKTWEDFKVKAGQGWSIETGVGVTENMVTLKNGEIISMVPVVPPSWWDEYGQRRGQIRPYVSADNGMNWSHVGTQPFPPDVSEETLDSLPLQGRGATVNAITQGPSGRVYFVYGGGNSEDYGFSEVWMSDNNGRSWFKSMTPIDAIQTGYVIAEAKVIETTQNTRFYFRTDKGQICYYESYDYGETWDMIPHTTPFISAMTCFSVEADPEDSDTLYIGWAYDTINLYARPQFSRTRWAVAKSTDAGVTWEMVGTVHENNSVEHNMMNLNINVAKDYIYLNAFSSDNYAATLPWSSRIVSFPKEKQRTSPRMEQLHIMYPTQIENAVILPAEQEELTLVIHPSSGNVTMHGQLIQNGAKGEYVALDIVAAFLGATVVDSNDSTATLQIGNSKVSFSSLSVKRVGEKLYLKISTIADKFNLSLVQENGTYFISPQGDWSERQKKALRYATDLFATMP